MRMDALLRLTLWGMVATDVGFLVYWLIVVLHVLPPDAMFAEYGDPRVRAWNWTFLPLDVAASLTGFAAARSVTRLPTGSDGQIPSQDGATVTAFVRLGVSLALTATAGGLAVAYWLLRSQYDPAWLVPNLFLLLFPLPMLYRLIGRGRLSPPTPR